MLKNKKFTLIAVAVVVLVVAAVIIFAAGGGNQGVQLEGYSLNVPKGWAVKTETDRLIFEEKGKEVGRFDLLYVQKEVAEIPAAFGFAPEKPQVRESDKYAVKVYEIRFRVGEDEICQYVLDGLPDAPPYQAVLTLKNTRSKTATKILRSVQLPELGPDAPVKPVTEVTDELLEQAVYTNTRGTSVYAYRLSKLDSLIRGEKEQDSEGMGLHILTCVSEEDDRLIKSWYYLSANGKTKMLYTYEQGENGEYFYRNQPTVVKNLTREVSREENYTRYYADDVLILEAPYNPYAENKEALLAYKDTLIGDSSNVSALVEQAMPIGIAQEGISLETEAEPYGMTLRYEITKPELYISDGVLSENAFYQNALVLFSLVTNVDRISMEIRSGETVFTTAYDRKVAEAQFQEQDLREYTKDEKAFETFTEDVPKMTPPSNGNSGNGIDGTRVVTSITVTITGSTQFRHPKTGKLVAVQPYAERYGVTGYLNKPITVTLYEKTNAGKTTMWAEGVCGGSLIGTYPISSRAEFDRLVGMVG